MSGDNERPRGILTPADRALLRGEVEFEHKQQYSNRRQDIRQRIANGILDFQTIQHLLSDNDRKRIFRDPGRESDVEDPQFHESIRALLYWIHLGLKQQNYDFEGLLNEAVEDAEIDYARKYWGESVEVNVRLDVDVTRSHDIGDVIAQIEQGGPIKANRLYNLLQLEGGVPIDTSELDELRVWFQSSYPEGERAVIESIFSEYLDGSVEISDAISRVDLENDDLVDGAETDADRESAVVRKDQPRSDPSEIKNYRDRPDFTSDEVELDLRPSEQRDSFREQADHSDSEKSILNSAVDKIVENSKKPAPHIIDIIGRGQTDSPHQEEPVTPERVNEMLENIGDPFVSTEEIAAVFNCATDAARQSLLTLLEEDKIQRHHVKDTAGNRLSVWWKPTQQK